MSVVWRKIEYSMYLADTPYQLSRALQLIISNVFSR